jgi:hypothetical protein
MTLKDVFTVVNRMEADGVIERYALGGAVAATFYLEPVATVDVDFFVAYRAESGRLLVSSKPIFDYLTARGHTVQGEYLVIAGWPVQFLPPTGPLVEEALAEAQEADIEGVLVRVLSAEHLAAIALETGRPKDHARLVQFVDSGILDEQRMAVILGRHGLLERWREFRQRSFGGLP